MLIQSNLWSWTKQIRPKSCEFFINHFGYLKKILRKSYPREPFFSYGMVILLSEILKYPSIFAVSTFYFAVIYLLTFLFYPQFDIDYLCLRWWKIENISNYHFTIFKNYLCSIFCFRLRFKSIFSNKRNIRVILWWFIVV